MLNQFRYTYSRFTRAKGGHVQSGREAQIGQSIVHPRRLPKPWSVVRPLISHEKLSHRLTFFSCRIELNFFYGQLQAMAFEEEFRPQRIPDKTLPLLDQMHKVRHMLSLSNNNIANQPELPGQPDYHSQRGGQAMREFNQSIEEDERAHQIYAKSSGSGAAGKRVRTDGGEMVDMTSDFVEEKWRSGNLSTVSIASILLFDSLD